LREAVEVEGNALLATRTLRDAFGCRGRGLVAGGMCPTFCHFRTRRTSQKFNVTWKLHCSSASSVQPLPCCIFCLRDCSSLQPTVIRCLPHPEMYAS
jgi:hypothetical protein